MERREDEERGRTDGRPLGEDGGIRRPGVSPGSSPGRGVAYWINWRSTLYLFVLGAICVLLVPLTSLWWVVPLLGVAVPIALAMLDNAASSNRVNADKTAEKELLEALTERGEFTPITDAMQTSLTVDEDSRMLEGLTCKGHLQEVRAGDDVVSSYALLEEDRRDRQERHTKKGGESPASLESPEDDKPSDRIEAASKLEDPLSERELEVLTLLASGRTNAEIARELYVALGTIKSHVNCSR